MKVSYLSLLFLQEPNHEDPLNLDAAAAAVLRDNPKTFQSNVRKAMAGGYVDETHTLPEMYLVFLCGTLSVLQTMSQPWALFVNILMHNFAVPFSFSI